MFYAAIIFKNAEIYCTLRTKYALFHTIKIKTLGIDLPPMYTASKQRLLDDSKRIDKAINTLNKIKSELRF